MCLVLVSDQIMDFQVLQNTLLNIPAFPYLWIPHCLLMSYLLRIDYGSNAVSIAKANPLSCYLKAILYTYPGGIMSSLLMAQPPFAFLANTPTLLTMSISWYLIFFSPKDIGNKLVNTIRIPLSIPQDFLRLGLCIQGVNYVSSKHPNAFVYMIFFSLCKSSGFMFLKYFEYAFNNGLTKPLSIPNYPTKTCILASVMFAIQATKLYDFGGNGVILAGLTLIVISLRIYSMLVATISDPYQGLEGLTCRVLFGIPPSEAETEKASKKVYS